MVAFTCHVVPLPCRGLMEKARVASRSAVRSPAPTASLHALRSIFFIARIRSQHHLRHQKYNYCKGGGKPLSFQISSRLRKATLNYPSPTRDPVRHHLSLCTITAVGLASLIFCPLPCATHGLSLIHI